MMRGKEGGYCYLLPPGDAHLNTYYNFDLLYSFNAMVRDTTRVNTTFDRVCTVYEEKTSAITFWGRFEIYIEKQTGDD